MKTFIVAGNCKRWFWNATESKWTPNRANATHYTTREEAAKVILTKVGARILEV